MQGHKITITFGLSDKKVANTILGRPFTRRATIVDMEVEKIVNILVSMILLIVTHKSPYQDIDLSIYV